MNIIEWFNRKCRTKTKSMEIGAGESACYRILVFIYLQIGLHWRSNPVGQVCDKLPFFKEWAYNNFTQTS